MARTQPLLWNLWPTRPLLRNGLSFPRHEPAGVVLVHLSVCPPVTRKASVTAPRHLPATRLLQGGNAWPASLAGTRLDWVCFCDLCGKHHCQLKRSVETSLKLTVGNSSETRVYEPGNSLAKATKHEANPDTRFLQAWGVSTRAAALG